MLDKHWHHLPHKEVLDLLDTDADKGLDPFETKERQQNFGANALPRAKVRDRFALSAAIQ